MEIWDKDKSLYIQDYKEIEDKQGRKKLRIIYSNGEDYDIDYSLESEEKITFLMEEQFKTAKRSGIVDKIRRAYTFEKYAGTISTGTGFVSLAAFVIERFSDSMCDDTVLLPMIIGGFVAGVPLILLANRNRRKVDEANLIEERDKNRGILNSVDADSKISSAYPTIENAINEGKDPFSIPQLEKTNDPRGTLSFLRHVITSAEQEKYLDWLQSASFDDVKRASENDRQKQKTKTRTKQKK